MASQWYRKVDDAEVGPLAFEDLVELILAGTLAEDDWVRRETSPEWIRAQAVLGLFAAAEKRRSAPPAASAGSPFVPETSESPAMSDAPATPAVRRKRRFKRPPLRYCLIGVAVVLLVCFGVHSRRKEAARRFPEHHLWGARRASPTHPLKVAWPKRPAPPPTKHAVQQHAVQQPERKAPVIPPLVTLLPGHGGVRSVAFSPNGRGLATAGDDGRARLWALGTLKCVRELGDHLGAVSSVVFSPDGSRVALAGVDRRITLWDTADGHRLAELKGHTGEVTGLKFSPDGKRLASSAYDSEVRVWDVEAAREVRKLKHLVLSQCMDWSPDGCILCAGAQGGWNLGDSYVVMLWNVETGQEIARLPGHRLHITAVRFSPDGKRLATGSSDYRLLLWDLASRKSVCVSTEWGPPGAAFLPDGQTLAAATHDGRVSLWDLSRLREAVQYEGHGRFNVFASYGWGIYSVAVSPDGSVAASTDRQGLVKFWPTFRGTRDQESTAARLEKVAAVAGRATLPSGASPRPSELIYSVAVQQSGALFATFSRDGRLLAAGGEDGTLTLLEAETGRVLKKVPAHEGAVLAGAFSPHGRSLVTGSRDSNVRLWDASSGKQIKSLSGPASWVRAAAFAPDGKSFVASNEAGLFRRWDADAAQELNSANLSPMASLALPTDGRLAATANWDTTVGVWNLADFKQVALLKGHPDYVISTAFSPDGQTLASTSGTYDPERNAKLWDTRTWKERAALVGHEGNVQSAAFSPDGKTVATAGSDRTVRLWNAAEGKPLKVFHGHTAAVVCVGFTPDGRRLVSAGLDGTVKVWNPGAR